MTVVITGQNRLASTKSPALPFAPVEYSQQYQDQFANILRIYFQSTDNFTNAMLDSRGARFLSAPQGGFISTTSQPAAVINTAYPVTLSAADTANNGIFIGGPTGNAFPDSKIYAVNPGLYNLQFSLQLKCTDSQLQDVNIWLRKNNTNVVNSNTLMSVPNKHGAVDGHTVAAWNFFVSYSAITDYYELVWSASSTLVSIPAAAAVAPAPATPSVILTMQFVSRL